MEPALAVGISITVIMLSALIFDRFKLPHILGVLVAGILLGPYSPLAGMEFFGVHFGTIIITDPSLVGVFATIGSALILFGIGLEFSVIKLAQLGLFTFLAAVVKLGIVYIALYAALAALGFPAQTAALVAVALSFSSTPILIKLLEATGKIRRPEVPFIISILIIEDLLAVFFLGLIANPPTSDYSFAISLLRVVLTFIFAYAILSRFVTFFLNLISHSDELLILGTVSLVLVIGYLSESIGLSFSVGAFLAGSTMVGSSAYRKIAEKIKPFNSLFASFFFFSIGLIVNVGSIFANPLLIVLFVLVSIPLRFFSGGIAPYFAGFNGRSAIFCAAAFLSLSELSLLLLSQGIQTGAVPSEFLGAFAFAIIASSFASAYLINRENEIYNFLRALVPQLLVKNIRLLRSTTHGMKRAVSESSRYYNVVDRLPSISTRTDQFSVREQLSLTSKNTALLAVLSAVAYLGIFFSGEASSPLNSFFIFLFCAFFIASALFLVNARSTSSCLMKMMVRSSTGSKYSFAGHLLIFAFFSALCAIYYLIYSLSPPSLAIILALPCMAFAAKSLFSAFRAISSGSERL